MDMELSNIKPRKGMKMKKRFHQTMVKNRLMESSTTSVSVQSLPENMLWKSQYFPRTFVLTA